MTDWNENEERRIDESTGAVNTEERYAESADMQDTGAGNAYAGNAYAGNAYTEEAQACEGAYTETAAAHADAQNAESYTENSSANVYNRYEDYTGYTMPQDNAEPHRPVKKKKKGGFGKKVAAAVLCGVLFGGSAAAAYHGGAAVMEQLGLTAETEDGSDSTTTKTTLQTTSTISSSGSSTSQSLDVSDVAEAVMPSMVAITNISVEEVQSYFGMFGQSSSQEVESTGSGIIIGENDTELLVVTNYHVIEDAETISVCFIDDSACEASVKGTDSDNDLAVIAVKLEDISDETMNEIAIATFGDSDSLAVGEQVVAIGNALGYGQSVTTGIVSALNRQIDTSDAIMIQTDAAINPGNSGGALVNMNGEVIGINSAKYSDTDVEGMGYAISISQAASVIEDLMNRTTREKVSDEEASYIGITGEEVTSTIEETYGIPQGVYVTSVVEGSPAEEAGIEAQNVITAFDGITVTSLSNLQDRLEYYAAGETVEITLQVLEDSEWVEKTVEVTLGYASEVETQSGQSSQNGMQGGMQGGMQQNNMVQ